MTTKKKIEKIRKVALCWILKIICCVALLMAIKKSFICVFEVLNFKSSFSYMITWLAYIASKEFIKIIKLNDETITKTEVTVAIFNCIKGAIIALVVLIIIAFI